FSRVSPLAPSQGPSTFTRPPSIAVSSQTVPYDTFLFRSAARPYNDSLDPTLHWQADARGPQPNGACFWAGYSLSVSPTGDVSPCILTQIANPEALLGNLRNDSMDAIIGRASAFRERLEIDGRQSFSLCASCFKVSGKPRPPRAPIDLRDQLTPDKIAN
ncbi:SPASM domain-containing protein, partial [Sphingopyxis sp. LC363]|uniref:SPASM domain-containing protein n=1 Tax=Sphingopyxis sp. LC363 TaxID=1120705 RepID=UPI001F32C4C2